MNTISAEEIERRGISALDELLKEGPVHVTKNNRPTYVVMREKDYARLIGQRGLWELLNEPTRETRSKEDIDGRNYVENGGAGTTRGKLFLGIRILIRLVESLLHPHPRGHALV